MRIRYRFLALCSCLVLLLAGSIALAAESPFLSIVAGTSLIEDIVNDVSGGRALVRSIVPAAACPGHHDMKASDLAFVKTASVILLHDWQMPQQHIQAVLRSESGVPARAEVVNVPGNWMVPDLQAQAALAIGDMLARIEPGKEAFFRAHAQARAAKVRSVGEELRRAVAEADVTGTPVFCEAMQRPFMEWLGFTVVATYGRFEEVSPVALAKSVAAAKRAGARLVVDNLQSTGSAGLALAQDIGAAHVTLSNFPGGFPDAPSWEEAVRKNLVLILLALESNP